MNSSSLSSTLVWILLDNEIWWPGILENERNTFLNGKTPSSFRIVSLFGTKERIIVDLSRSENILQNTNCMESFYTAYTEQIIPENLYPHFLEAVKELNEYRPKENDESLSTPSDLSLTRSLKRKDALTWDDYFIAVAFLSAMRSKDPSTQVGACIVNNRNRIVGIGYNGFPRGCSDDILPWARSADNELDTKYPVSPNVDIRVMFPIVRLSRRS